MSKAVWWILKWLVVPLGLLAIGFFLIGPQIGKSNAKTVSVTTDAPSGPPSTDNSSTTDSSQASPADTTPVPADNPDAPISTSHTPPVVTVTVERGSSFRAGRYYSDSSTRRHSRHKKKKKSGDGASAPAATPEIPMDNGDQGA